VIAVEGNAESVPKIRITEKHFAGVAKAKSVVSHPQGRNHSSLIKNIGANNTVFTRDLTVNNALHLILPADEISTGAQPSPTPRIPSPSLTIRADPSP
jgi:hypothetical protein